MLSGTVTSFGSYDECVDTTVTNSYGRILMNGQYCTINFRPPLPTNYSNSKSGEVPYILKNISQKGTIISELMKSVAIFKVFPFRLGICVPSGCEVEDINKFLKLVGDLIYFESSVSRCEMKKELKFNKAEIFSIAFYGILGTLVLVATYVDIYYSTKKMIFNSKGAQILMAFSLPRNIKKLLRTDNKSEILSCIPGIRFFSIAWIVLTHTYFFLHHPSLVGLSKVKDMGKSFAFQAIINGTFAVETFFCIGGLLLSFVLISQGRRNISIPQYLLHRIWRILPPSAATIPLVILTPQLGSGPIWYETTNNFTENCHNNWWSNLIFINNFYKVENMCLIHTWYIASDMQMYVAALIILLPLLKWPNVGLCLGFLGLIGSIVYCGVNTYIKDLPPTMLIADPKQYEHYCAVHYFKPFPHVGSYCIGILAGYVLATKPKLKISSEVQVLGWCLSAVCCISTLFGALKWNSGNDYTTMEAVAYDSLSRQTSALGVTWVLVCCATGHGGILNTILSWKGFVPLGRLTFVVYLLHPIIQIVFMGNKTTLIQSDHFIVVWYFFGHLLVSFILGVIFSMIIEAPFLNLEKILLSHPESDMEVKTTDIHKESLQTDKNGPDAMKNTEASDEHGYIVYKL